jgi:hypothetical protein
MEKLCVLTVCCCMMILSSSILYTDINTGWLIKGDGITGLNDSSDEKVGGDVKMLDPYHIVQ